MKDFKTTKAIIKIIKIIIRDLIPEEAMTTKMLIIINNLEGLHIEVHFLRVTHGKQTDNNTFIRIAKSSLKICEDSSSKVKGKAIGRDNESTDNNNKNTSRRWKSSLQT